MVDMAVGDYNEVNIPWIEWKILIVEPIQIFSTLKQTAVDEKVSPGNPDLMT